MQNDFLSLAKRFRTVRNQSPVPYVSTRTLFGAYDSVGTVADRAFDAYGSSGTLYAIVSQIARAVAKTPWHLYQRTSTRDKSKRKEILNSAFMDVWDRPNPFYTGRLLRETVQMHCDLVGEGCMVLNRVNGVVYEIWPVRPDRIQPVKHPTQFITGWIYTGPNGEEVPLELDNVIRIQYPNPADPYRGMGPVQTVLYDIDAARFGAQWNANFFINGARPGGIIKFDYKMGDDEFKDFIARWRAQHQGVAQAHRVAILENAEWIDTNYSMEDMQFAELRNLPRELIREAFAFPKPMLGTVDDVNRANSEASKEIMAEGQSIPRLDYWKEVVNTFLLPQFSNGKAQEIDYEDPTPVNIEQANAERTSKTTAYATLVQAGVHPDDAAEATGMPKMRMAQTVEETSPDTTEQSTNETDWDTVLREWAR